MGRTNVLVRLSGGPMKAANQMNRVGYAGNRSLLLFLAVLTAVVYANTVFNGFVWDDEFIIVNNPTTSAFPGLGTLLSSPDVTKPYYRPLTRLSYVLDFTLFGMNPKAFHAVNVLIHLLNVLLLFILGLRLFAHKWPAFFAAILIAVHPINTEAVNFISGRNNLLALFFVLVSLLLFLEGRERRSRGLFCASGLALFLGLLSKETALPAFVILVVLAFFRSTGSRLTLGQAGIALVPHLAGLTIYFLFRSSAIGGTIGVEGIYSGLIGRLVGNAVIFPRYLGLILFPSGLSIAHGAPPDNVLTVPWLLPVWGIIFIALWGCWRWATLTKILGLLWFGANILLVANIIPIPSAPMAERYLYIPAVGLWMIAADFGYELYSRVQWKPVLRAAVVALILALAVVTMRRNFDWQDDLSLFKSVVRVEPRSVMGHLNLGNALLDQKELEGARREWETVLRLDPDHPAALTQLGTLAATAGNLPEAERRFRAALASDADMLIARFNLARICELTGRPLEALRQYDLVLAGKVPPEYRDYLQISRQRRTRLLKKMARSE